MEQQLVVVALVDHVMEAVEPHELLQKEQKEQMVHLPQSDQLGSLWLDQMVLVQIFWHLEGVVEELFLFHVVLEEELVGP